MTAALAVGAPFLCNPVAVWDGDGPMWCAEGPKVRLVGIAAREIDETCRPHHPCPKASGKAARDYLVKLLGGPKGTLPTGHIKVRTRKPLRCVSTGPAVGGRTGAWCRTEGVGDLSCAMVKAGYALAWREHGGRAVCRGRP